METRSGEKVKVMEEQREPLLDPHPHPTAPSPQLCQQQGWVWGSLWLHRQPGPALPSCLLLPGWKPLHADSLPLVQQP